MRRWLSLLCCLLAVTGVSLAQDATPVEPISTLEAGDFRALAVTHDGSRLLVADAENNQVRVYDFTDPETPTRLTSIDTSGTPVLLSGGAGFGLAAVTTSEDTDLVEVVVPVPPGARLPVTSGSIIPIDKDPRALALSPNSHWGIVVSDASYTLLEINAPDNVDSIPFDERLVGAALSDTNAYLLRENSLEIAPLDALAALSASQTLEFTGTASAVALNADSTLGVIVVDGTRLLFFNPQTLQESERMTVEGSPVSSVHFIGSGETETVLVTQEGGSSVIAVNGSDPQASDAMASAAENDRPIQALATFEQFLIITDGVTIRIFAT